MGQVLSVSELKKYYEVRKTVFSVRKETIKALDSVSLELGQGRTLGIVGESGSGKSTLARCVLLLERPDSGSIQFQGKNLVGLEREELKGLRRDMQIIFQDPYSSLNPRKKVFDVLAEPLLFHNVAGEGEVAGNVMEILRKVGLDEDFLHKYPYEMSGGQRQRVAIGRALTTNPSLLIADEPVSSLDVSIQAQIVNLFLDIRESFNISMLFISHDLNIVRFISDEIMVMYAGRVVETGERDEVFYRPLHPYTEMLIGAARGDSTQRVIENPFGQGQGCAYSPRCGRKNGACMHEVPSLKGDKNHLVACFRE
jgi:oligopeptide transport system ATP-binding protein